MTTTSEQSDILAKARRLILAATGEEYGDGETVTNIGVGYAEPGYSDNAVWVLGNWNDKGPSGSWVDNADGTRVWVKPEPSKSESIPSRLGNALEGIGVKLEWSDEWMECSNCYRIFRTAENSYSWKPSYLWEPDSCEPLCADCAKEEGEDALASYVNEPTRAITWADGSHVEQYGYVLYNRDHSYESGWHEGMNDDPKVIYDRIKRESASSDVVFVLDELSQFYIGFSAYVKHLSHYHVIQNTAGYMPEADEPTTCATYDEARDILLSDMDRIADSEANRDESSGKVVSAMDEAMRELQASDGPEFLTYVELIDSEHCIPTAFSIVQCDESECETDD